MEMRTLAVVLAGITSAAGVAGAQQARRGNDPPDLALAPTRAVSLHTDRGTWMSLDVSPDGRTIVFDFLGDLYTIPIDGGAATSLTSGMAFDAQPRFSPDGQSIVFTSDRDGGDNVWTMTLTTRAMRQITRGKTSRYRSPVWTPDGEYIVVARGATTDGPSKLYMYEKDGGTGFQLTRDASPPDGPPISTLGPAFGRDGRQLWYAQRFGSSEYSPGFPQYQLFSLDRVSGRRELRARLYGGAFRPALSPDGHWLVYGSRYENQTGLRIRDLATNEERWLAYPVQRDEQEASVASLDVLPGYAFTPDSRAIVASYGGKIWRVPVDGSPQTNIPFQMDVSVPLGPKLEFTYPISDSAEFTVKQIRNAVPSPDDRQLAFTALDKVYVMDYPGGVPRRVTNLEGFESEPAWSPDGQWIAFARWTRDGGYLYKVRAAGGQPIQLTTASAHYAQPAWTPDGSRVVAIRSPAQAMRERDGFIGPSELVWVPAIGGAPTFIAPAQGRTAPQFVQRDTGRIYLSSQSEGLVSIRWDGSDSRVHVRVNGLRMPEAPQPAPALAIRIAPGGERAIAQVANELYVMPVPHVGDVPTINLANPAAAEVPAVKVTDVGGQFPAWSADGRRVHWSIGHTHVVYDVDSMSRAPEYHGVETEVVVRARRDIPQATALLRGARIITMRGGAAGPGEVIEHGDILVRNNRIAAIGPTGTLAGVPGDARVFDLRGKTILPGFIDTHMHTAIEFDEHEQPWSYLANLAYGVTTFRDPQPGTTDVLTYEDEVRAGAVLGPRVNSTGPGIFGPNYSPLYGDDIKSLDDARRIMKRYSRYYDTHTIKMYITGNRQQRQWIVMAAREQGLMPTTEGAADYEQDITLALDGYPEQEHGLPVTPLYGDVEQLFVQSGIINTLTLLVAYGSPFGENYWYTHAPPYNDSKMRRFTPYEELASKSRRRVRGGSPGEGNGGGWFMDDEYNFPAMAHYANEMLKAGGRFGLGGHGVLNGIGYHWEMWSYAMGGMSPMDILRCATVFGAQALGLFGDVGSLEPGKMADLLVLDANPLENIRNTNTIRYVMVNGRMYDGNSLDELYPRQRTMEPVLGTPHTPDVRAGIVP